MIKQQSPLRQSFNILNSFLLSVFAIFLLDTAIARSFFPESLVISPLGLFVFILLVPLNIYFHSGIYGSLVELASGEEMILTSSKFKENAKKFWKIFFLLALLPYFVHFLLFVLLRDKNVPVKAVEMYLNIIVLYLLSVWIINKKYLQPLHLSRRHIKVNIHAIGVIIFLYMANLFLFYLPQWIETGDFDLARAAVFLSKYAQLLTFLYLTILVLKQYPKIEGKFHEEKELFLINPSNGGVWMNISFLLVRNYPPLFVVLKALTPKHYKIREFNRIMWRQRYYQENKLVAITGYTFNSPEVYKIAKEFKKRGSKVILGGPHVTYLPDEALEYADSVVIGEAEGVWRDVIKDYENDSLKKTYLGTATEEDYKEVHQELLNSPPEVIKDFLETTRGCKYHCDFCTIPALSQGKIRTKPVHEILQLIKKIKRKYREIVFIDNNIYADPGYAKELFKALKPLNIKWGASCTLDIAEDEGALRLAKESGCVGLFFGYEIVGDSPEKQQGGKLAMAEKYLLFSRKVREKGISIRSGFMIGFASHSVKEILRTWRFCRAIKPFTSAMAFLTPFPGTSFYYNMLKEDRIINLNWHKYNMMTMVFKHEQMTNPMPMRLFSLISISFLLTTSRIGCAVSMFIILCIFVAALFSF